MQQLLIGQQLGPYHIETILGRGGMSIVYRARQPNDEAVALKVLTLPVETNSEIVARFDREARTAARLKHPGIVPVIDYGQANGYLFLAMPLIKGHSLADHLVEHRQLDEAAAIDIAWQIADALYYAHTQGVIHRDVKPSNILLTDDGQAMLTDFGVALALDEPNLTRTGYTIGTPAYMAPEQVSGQKHVDGRADLYSLGVVLYQMVTGRLPFQGHTPQILYAHVHKPPPSPASVATVSPKMAELILTALAKDVSQRFQTGQALAKALTHADSQSEIVSTFKTISQRPPDSSARLKLAGLVAVMLLIGGTIIVWQVSPATPTPTPLPTEAIAAVTLPGPTATLSPSPTATPQPPLSPTPTLPFSAGSLLQGSGEGVFRLSTTGQMQHIYDWPTFLAFGFDQTAIKPIDDNLLNELFHGVELTRLLEAEDDYLDWVVAGERWRIDRWQGDLAQSGYQGLPPSQADPLLLANLPLTVAVEELPVGTLVREGDNFYRLFAGGLLRRFREPALLTAYGYQPETVIDMPDEVRHLYRTGPPLTELLQATNEVAIYRLADGQRQSMPTGEALYDLGYGNEDISQVPADFLMTFPLADIEPTSTPSPPPEPASSPTPTSCSQSVDETFSELLNTELFAQLGCPVGQAITTSAAWQPFETGLMLWRQDTNLIYILTTNRTNFMGDTWRQDIDPAFDSTIQPPADLFQPVRGFGKIWREQPAIREALGWATAEEQGFSAIIQPFTNGLAWRDEAGEFSGLLLSEGGYYVNGDDLKN